MDRQLWLLTVAIRSSLIYLPAAHAIATITATGSKLFDANGNQFFIKGVTYGRNLLQLGETDPLANASQCALDVPLMKSLGVNTVRSYTLNNTQNHDSCMATFEEASIYVLVGLETPLHEMSRANPQWDMDLYTQYTKTLDAFAGYDNLLGIFVGNEIISTATEQVAAPYIKAAARDIKAYRDSKGYRKIPVGYAGADVSALSPWLQNYLACGSTDSETIDMFGQNQYSWCGDSSYTASGYDTLTANASIYNIPIFFSETGCRDGTDERTFTDQTAIFGPQMAQVWSGAIIYEWIQQDNDYGLVEYLSDSEISTISPDYSNLRSQWAENVPAGTASSHYSPTNTPPPCPKSTAGGWSIDANAALPTISGLTIPPPSSTKASSSTQSDISITSSQPSMTNTPGANSSSSISLTSSEGLSTGVKVAIGVVVPLIVVALLLLTFWAVRYRKKQKMGLNFATKASIDTPNEHSKPELEAGTVSGLWGPVAPKSELNAAPHLEKSALSQELPSESAVSNPSELAASTLAEQSSSLSQPAVEVDSQPSNALRPAVADRSQDSEAPWQYDFTYHASSTAIRNASNSHDAAIENPSSIPVKRKALANAEPVNEALGQDPTLETGSKDVKIAQLIKEQEKINEERERIKALQELDKKEAEIRQRLEALN